MMKVIRVVFMYGFLVLAFIGAIYAMDWMEKPEEGIPEENSIEEKANRVRIDTLEIIPQHFVEKITVPGVVEAKEDVTLGASIIGILEKKFVEEGQEVKAGDELFQIDLRERKARLNEVQSAYDLAKTNLERIQSLFKKGNITRQEYDDAIAVEEQTSASLQRMQVEISLGIVKAPVDGIIDKTHVDVGEFMHEGRELARLINIDQVELMAGVAERYADAVNREREGSVFIEALQERFPITVKRVAFGGDTSTNTFEVSIVIENPDHRIRPGMIAMMDLIVRRTDDALLVPFFSVTRSEKGMMVFIEEEGIVHERIVKLGGFRDDHIEVVSGLEAHDRVVVIGQKELVDSQQVQVMNTKLQEQIQ